MDGIEPILFTIGGNSYQITPDNTANKYIYWNSNYTTTFQSTNTLSEAIGAGKWLMCVNDAGTSYAPNVFKIIHGGLIQAGTITAAFLSSISANLGNITSGEILLSLGGDTLMKINTSGIYVSNNAGSTWLPVLYNNSGTVCLKVGTADITDLNVTTLKIANNATKNLYSEYYSTESGYISIIDYQTAIFQDNVPCSGGVVDFTGGFTVHNYSPSQTVPCYFKLLQADTGHTYTFTQMIPPQSDMNLQGLLSEIIAAGNKDFYVQVKGVDFECLKVRNCWLRVEEWKGK
jgi:hypothetical protein